jgi:hypothetical protein
MIPVGPSLLEEDSAAARPWTFQRGPGEGSGGGSGHEEGVGGPVLRSDFEGAEALTVARTRAFNLEVKEIVALGGRAAEPSKHQWLADLRGIFFSV